MGLTNVLVFEIEGLLGLTIRTTISSSKPLEALASLRGFRHSSFQVASSNLLKDAKSA
jgi:hypothetical protein